MVPAATQSRWPDEMSDHDIIRNSAIVIAWPIKAQDIIYLHQLKKAVESEDGPKEKESDYEYNHECFELYYCDEFHSL